MSDIRDDPKVQDLVRRLRCEFDPCTIWLFGSRVTTPHGARPDSDYDVMSSFRSPRKRRIIARRERNSRSPGFRRR